MLAHRHHIAYSLANGKDIIKGHQAYIDSERGEHMRFTVINGNVPLYKGGSPPQGFINIEFGKIQILLKRLHQTIVNIQNAFD